MRAHLLLGVALLSIAAPMASMAQDASRADRRAARQAERGAQQAAPAAAVAQPGPAASAPVTAPQPQPQGYPRERGNIRDRRQLFTGPNDPAATPQDRRELWGDRGGGGGPRGDRDHDGVQNRFDRDRNGDGRVDPRLRDRDRDGIPNRFDRDRNGDGRVDNRFRDRDRDGVPNRFDRDRDGDGIPNRFDNRPNQRFRGGFFSGDRRPFNYNGRTFYRFRAEPYRWPNAQYRNYRWSRGTRLPASFLLQNYFISDYYALGLQPAPYGYQWVRVGYDVLLVNQYTGEIADVVPGVFYW